MLFQFFTLVSCVLITFIDATPAQQPVLPPQARCDVDGWCCQSYGNLYKIVPGSQCRNYTQEDMSHNEPLPALQHCNEKTVFDTQKCTCDWADFVNCVDTIVPTPPAPETTTAPPTASPTTQPAAGTQVAYEDVPNEEIVKALKALLLARRKDSK